MKEIKNLPASIHTRLANKARERNRPFQELFYYYILERLLYRLAQSPYAQSFVLKGGLMFYGWGLSLRRPTRDIDLQGYTSNSVENLVEMVRNVCTQSVPPDGVTFDPEFVHAQPIMENAEYQGFRVFFKAYLGSANLQTHLDISFGNVIKPSDILVTYPTIFAEMPSFQIRGYPYEAAIAEKFQTMIFWENANDRMKDFYDIFYLSLQITLPGPTLVEAIQATFQTRRTALPLNIPVALSDAFAQARQPDWISFLDRSLIKDVTDNSFVSVVQHIRSFLLPPTQAAAHNSVFDLHWIPAGPWIENDAPSD